MRSGGLNRTAFFGRLSPCAFFASRVAQLSSSSWMPAISLSSFPGFFVLSSARRAPFPTISWSMALARFARAPLNLGLVLGERANRALAGAGPPFQLPHSKPSLCFDWGESPPLFYVRVIAFPMLRSDWLPFLMLTSRRALSSCLTIEHLFPVFSRWNSLAVMDFSFSYLA